VLRLLAELMKGGTRGIIYTGGGEPTLHRDLPAILRATVALGLDAALITNGLVLTEELREAVAECCTWCRVSVDAGSHEGYARSHGLSGGEFFEVRQNVGAYARKPRNATIGVGVLVDADFLGEMLPATENSKAAGVDYIQFRPYYTDGWFGGGSPADPEAYAKAFAACQALATPDFAVLHSGPKFDLLASGKCARDYQECRGQQFCGVITAKGDVALCCLMRGRHEFDLGNIRTHSFREVWDGARRRDVLARLDVAKDCPPLCRCDGMNRWLARIGEPMHGSFL